MSVTMHAIKAGPEPELMAQQPSVEIRHLTNGTVNSRF